LQKRHAKEKREMEKQLAKAELYLKNQSAAEIIKRTKFLRGKKLSYELNQEMICKTNLLLGIKVIIPFPTPNNSINNSHKYP
jgi:hypothetical protein